MWLPDVVGQRPAPKQPSPNAGRWKGFGRFPANPEGYTGRMEPFGGSDLATLRAIARGAGLPDADQMSREELVVSLRDAGLSEPAGKPIDTTADTDRSALYHGEGVGRREAIGGAGAQATRRE